MILAALGDKLPDTFVLLGEDYQDQVCANDLVSAAGEGMPPSPNVNQDLCFEADPDICDRVGLK